MPQNTNSHARLKALLVVVAAFIGAFVSFGVTYTFGIFLRPIADTFHVTHAAMSVLFAVIAGLTFFLAPITGELADHHGSRPVVAFGAVLMCIALLATGRVHSFWLLIFTYGGGLGTAAACIYIPAISDVGEWFTKGRDIAMGIAISGIGCGTLVAAPLSAILINRYGWRTAMEVFGWASGGLLLLSAALLSPPPDSSKRKKVAISTELRTPAFRLLYVSLMFAGVAVYVALVYMPAYAADIGVPRVAAAAVIGYIGAASVVGRLGLNGLAPRFGLMFMYQLAYGILMVSFVLWLTAHSYAALVLFGIVMGVGYGGIAAMAPPVAAAIFGIAGLGELLGIMFTGFGLACIVGPPLAGVLVDYTHDFRWPVFVAAGAAVLALLVVIPLGKYKAEAAKEGAAAG
ncbi:MAG TPA: MFS transporter [Terriglobales bacterium]|jgi:MFS family permease